MATITDNSTNSATKTPAEVTRGVEKGHAEPTCEEIAAEAAAIYPDTSPQRQRPSRLQQKRTPSTWQRGCEDGRDMDDWYEAERKLKRSS